MRSPLISCTHWARLCLTGDNAADADAVAAMGLEEFSALVLRGAVAGDEAQRRVAEQLRSAAVGQRERWRKLAAGFKAATALASQK